jgi:large subunit ribosomal protein L25
MTQETISLTLEPRDVTGKAVKQLRNDGTVPAVIHDHGKDSLVVQGDAVQMLKVWKLAGKHHPVQLSASGKKYTALIKAADFSPKKHTLTHIVFNAVAADEKVDAEVPIQPQYAEGNDASPAERSGNLVLSQLEAVAVEAIPAKLPDVLYYDAEKLVEVGDSATVADLIVPEGVVIKADENHAIATVFEPSAMAAANEAAGGDAEPGDEANVESETESSAEEGTQAAEIRPGGKKEFEDKEQGHNPTKN